VDTWIRWNETGGLVLFVLIIRPDNMAVFLAKQKVLLLLCCVVLCCVVVLLCCVVVLLCHF
jgi:hypothetical protein